MKALLDVRERIEKALEPTSQGALGLVEELLALACEHNLSFDWGDGGCRVRIFAGARREEFDVSLPQPVFRAALARVAVLCNERAQNSVSPYGGAAQLTSASGAVLNVEFANRPGDQRLSIGPHC